MYAMNMRMTRQYPLLLINKARSNLVQFICPLSRPFTFLRKHKIFLSSHEKTTSQLRAASSICYNRKDQAIERERHLNPAVGDVIQSLKTARFFLKFSKPWMASQEL